MVVTDGDTIRIDGATWRLWGIDVLEGRQTCRIDARGYECGDQARAALLEIIGHQKPICRLKDTACSGRSVGQCFVEEKDIGAELVREV